MLTAITRKVETCVCALVYYESYDKMICPSSFKKSLHIWMASVQCERVFDGQIKRLFKVVLNKYTTVGKGIQSKGIANYSLHSFKLDT